MGSSGSREGDLCSFGFARRDVVASRISRFPCASRRVLACLDLVRRSSAAAVPGRPKRNNLEKERERANNSPNRRRRTASHRTLQPQTVSPPPSIPLVPSLSRMHSAVSADQNERSQQSSSPSIVLPDSFRLSLPLPVPSPFLPSSPFRYSPTSTSTTIWTPSSPSSSSATGRPQSRIPLSASSGRSTLRRPARGSTRSARRSRQTGWKPPTSSPSSGKQK